MTDIIDINPKLKSIFLLIYLEYIFLKRIKMILSVDNIGKMQGVD